MDGYWLSPFCLKFKYSQMIIYTTHAVMMHTFNEYSRWFKGDLFSLLIINVNAGLERNIR